MKGDSHRTTEVEATSKHHPKENIYINSIVLKNTSIVREREREIERE